MNHPTPSRMWETFLRIGESARFNSAQPEGSAARMADERESTLAALRAVRDEVLPLVRGLAPVIEWYSFLIHDRDGGVPTEDDGAYLHLRLSLAEGVPIDACLHYKGPNAPWTMTRQIPEETVGDTWPWWILGEQSALLLAVVEHNQHLDDMPLLLQVGQVIHHFSNMAQLPFPRPEWCY